jgi:hypothetical protein
LLHYALLQQVDEVNVTQILRILLLFFLTTMQLLLLSLLLLLLSLLLVLLSLEVRRPAIVFEAP